ncbi:MAG: hypothetical protein MUO63_15450 [Desulfobulbaceae bacterium]|nr:hypothetical protein [Desulfobulbaceae bacterium]
MSLKGLWNEIFRSSKTAGSSDVLALPKAGIGKFIPQLMAEFEKEELARDTADLIAGTVLKIEEGNRLTLCLRKKYSLP